MSFIGQSCSTVGGIANLFATHFTSDFVPFTKSNGIPNILENIPFIIVVSKASSPDGISQFYRFR